jgi:predicted CXXCH cytochrome family protein
MPSLLRTTLLLVGALMVVIGGATWWVLQPPEWERDLPISSVLPRELLRRSGFPPAGAQDCKSCHAQEFEEWSQSQHARANRLVNPLQDGPAFNPTRAYREGLLATEVSEKWGRFIVRQTGANGTPSFHRAIAVIGVEPLIQYLAAFPGGRLQVINPAYDPKKGDWFDIYKGEPRGPHEWGFWKNLGMNWNSQCATCHMTGFEKNYDVATDTYSSTWKAMGISCSQCHGELVGHAANPKVPVRLSGQQTMAVCASCHSRREELTGRFHPGESLDDHFRVTLPDLTDIYHPDGQVRDEDFEYASFLTSKMGHAGITCLDCHNPHSGKLRLPVENNALCLSCHSTPGQRGAIPIPDAVAHSHHKPESMGNRCVECHMAQTTYMARDPRRDHGFRIPDPLLTKELGIPNSCNRCHADQSTDWAIGWTQEWYKMERPSRERARLVARARAGDPRVTKPIIDFFKTEPNPAWRAALVSMLEGREPDHTVQDFLAVAASDESPLVRAAAVRTLGSARADVLKQATSDSSRNVRISSSWQLLMSRQSLPPGPRKEIEDYLLNSSDQVGAAFFQARLAAVENRLPDMEWWAEKATSRDPSPGMFQQAGQLMYQANKLQRAKSFFDQAIAADPSHVDATYSLALLEQELGNPTRARELLQKTVALSPEFGRAWYNLGLAEAAYGDLPASASALEKAVVLLPNNADPAYALATIYLRMKEPGKAVEAAKKALLISPGHPEARSLLKQLMPLSR